MYSVYVGKWKGDIVYVGITMQVPKRRFQWHKSNGKDLDFEVIESGLDKSAAEERESELIALHSPTLNRRGMTLPASHLTESELKARKGNDWWCQKCLRRHVNAGFKVCGWCA